MKPFTQPILWKEDSLHLLDQRKLPHEKKFVICKSLDDTYRGIKDMVVRGAPCIGYTGIFGMALLLKDESLDLEMIREKASFLISARPTAVNLEYEIKRCLILIESSFGKKNRSDIFQDIVDFGLAEMDSAFKDNQRMGELFAEELKDIYGPTRLKVLTHCNTGTLACGTLGTALGGICILNDYEMLQKVWVDETRPYLQGSRLTAFELTEQEIDYNIVVEGAASYLMQTAQVDAIVVGADRIAFNGDTANKIGTSNLAIIANYYDIPFYVLAPTSSIDLNLDNGRQIDIELRPDSEILEYKEHFIAPKTSNAYNPSFDITEGHLIKGIICEKGLFRGKDGLGELKRILE